MTTAILTAVGAAIYLVLLSVALLRMARHPLTAPRHAYAAMAAAALTGAIAAIGGSPAAWVWLFTTAMTGVTAYNAVRNARSHREIQRIGRGWPYGSK